MVDVDVHGVCLREHHVRNQLVGHHQVVCHTVGVRTQYAVGILQGCFRVFIYSVVECFFKFSQRSFWEVFIFAASGKECGNGCYQCEDDSINQCLHGREISKKDADLSKLKFFFQKTAVFRIFSESGVNFAM